MTSRSFLFWLSFCNVIFSYSLFHFRELATDDVANNALKESIWDEQVVRTLDTFQVETSTYSLVEESVESCAKQCLEAKFFCRFFMVVNRGDEMLCIMDYDRNEFLVDYFTEASDENPSAKLVAAYECLSHFHAQGLFSSIKQEIDNVATISKDPTLLNEKRFNELLRGYGVSTSFDKPSLFDEDQWDSLEIILKTCKAALAVHKPTPTSFKDWLEGEESPSSGREPILGSRFKGTNNGERPRKRPRLDDAPDFSDLPFLDLFSRAIDRRTETIYDPDNGTLYIHSPNIQLLLIVYGKYDYIWAVFGNNASKQYVELGVAGPVGSRQDVQNDVFDVFKKALDRSGHGVPNLMREVSKTQNSYLWRLIIFLTGNFWALGLGNDYLLIHDLSQVVPFLNQKRMIPYTEQVRKSFPGEHIDIITQKK